MLPKIVTDPFTLQVKMTNNWHLVRIIKGTLSEDQRAGRIAHIQAMVVLTQSVFTVVI